MSKESIFDTRMNGPLLLDPGAAVADPRHEKFAGTDAGGVAIDISTGVVDARAALALADAVSAPILLSPGAIFRVASDLVLSGDIRGYGGVIRPDSGVTVTINGAFGAGTFRCFDLSLGGTVLFGSGATERIIPQWWGADPTGVTSSRAAFEGAFAATNCVFVPLGTYDIAGLDVQGKSITGAGPETLLTGSGDLLINAEGFTLVDVTLENTVAGARGRLVQVAPGAAIGKSRFIRVRFAKSTHHIYAPRVAVDWFCEDCMFQDASVYSRFYHELWAYREEHCYTWFNEVGLYVRAGQTIGFRGCVFEYNRQQAVVLDVQEAGRSINAINFDSTHFEGNGSTSLGEQVLAQTSAAGRIRNLSFTNGCSFVVSNAVEAVRLVAGGGGNISRVTFSDCFTAAALVTAGFLPVLLNVEFNTGAAPADALVINSDEIRAPRLVVNGVSGASLGTFYAAGVNGASSLVQAVVTPPANARTALIAVQGDYYNDVAGAHDGYWMGQWQSASNRIFEMQDVNNTVGGNQGWDVTWTGTQIQIANKAAMGFNQSGRVTIQFFGA